MTSIRGVSRPRHIMADEADLGLLHPPVHVSGAVRQIISLFTFDKIHQVILSLPSSPRSKGLRGKAKKTNRSNLRDLVEKNLRKAKSLLKNVICASTLYLRDIKNLFAEPASRTSCGKKKRPLWMN
ncbi:hypothetical protein GDO81_018994 [Engystomops pustulosus]|uniref:Uncharacterized protein n=1 Tax=Engystomops pustulosus TaxID=76066 RepID=A0AAV6YKU4_ENGPU|nr:hypothetical protein GDO81_018994 [Engystomops pustulosus]